MGIVNTKKAFIQLGTFLSNFTEKFNKNQTLSSPFEEELSELIQQLPHHNAWFTKENVIQSLTSWGRLLSESNLEKWLKNYNFKNIESQRVAIIMAGNIPLVGFHDFVCVLLSGHSVEAKLSSNDKLLLPFLSKVLISFSPELVNKISFIKDRLIGFDAVIATGSNNTARYFEYYFSKKPHIIRKNRNSVAILSGNETEEELKLLADDIFTYFGLGCRSVSKLFVPQEYDFDKFFKAMYKFKDIIYHPKYANNYDYNKAVYLMSKFQLLDNGFLVLKEDLSFGSPIACVFYEKYSTEGELNQLLTDANDQIQCIVKQQPNPKNPKEVYFGEAQSPQLWDYADGVDTMKFLEII